MKWIRGRARAWVDERCSDLLSGEPCPFTTAYTQLSLEVDCFMFCRTCFPKGNGSVLLKVSPEFATWSGIHQPDQDDSKVVPDRRVVHVPGSLDWGSQVASWENFDRTVPVVVLIESKASLAGKKARSRMVQLTAI